MIDLINIEEKAKEYLERRYGCSVRQSAPRRSTQHGWSDAEDELLFSLVREGVKPVDMPERFRGRSYSAIKNRLTYLRRREREGIVTDPKRLDHLTRQYLKMGMTAASIRARLGISKLHANRIIAKVKESMNG